MCFHFLPCDRKSRIWQWVFRDDTCCAKGGILLLKSFGPHRELWQVVL